MAIRPMEGRRSSELSNTNLNNPKSGMTKLERDARQVLGFREYMHIRNAQQALCQASQLLE